MNFYYLIILFIFLNAPVFAQPDTIFYTKGDYSFESVYNDADFESVLLIRIAGLPAERIVFDERITDIKGYDLSGKGTDNIIIDLYSGGAHCCFTMLIADFENGRLTFRDSIYWGNSLYEIKDINDDGILEIVGGNDALAYSFTPYAWTEFPLTIYNYSDGNAVLSNWKFPEVVESEINVLVERLREVRYFKCADPGEDTFYTDAGIVKGILAAIVWNYNTIGSAEKGYDFLNKIYNCPDREEFISILRDDFNLN